MENELNITQEEYIGLRRQGMSKDDIVSQHSRKPKGFVQGALDTGTAVTNFLGGKKIAETFGAEIARARAKTQTEKNIISAGAPSVQETIGSGIQLGANLLPVGRIGTAATKLLAPIGSRIANVGGRALTGAGLGYAFDVGRNLEQGASVEETFKPGSGTVVGGVLPILGKIVGYAVGRGSANASRVLEQINLRMTPIERQNLQRKGQDIAQYLSEKKIIGTPEARYAKVNKLYEAMEDTVSGKIKDARILFSKSKLINEVQRIPDSFENDPELQTEARNIVSALVKNLQSRKGNSIPGEMIQELKRNYMKRAFAKNATDVVSDTRLAIGGYLKGRLDDYIPGLKGTNREYGLLIAANRALQKATTRPQIGLVGKIVGTGAGGALGGALGGGVGAAAGIVAGPMVGKAVAGTLPRSALGAGLQRVSELGELLKKLPLDAAGNVSLKAVLDTIEKFR